MESLTRTPLVQENHLKRRIMRRIYATWFWKHVAPVLAVEFILLSGVAVGVLTHISLRQILLNSLQASASVRAFAVFFISNFFVKSIQSQLLILVYGAILGFFVRDLRHALRRLNIIGKGEVLAHTILTGNR